MCVQGNYTGRQYTGERRWWPEPENMEEQQTGRNIAELEVRAQGDACMKETMGRERPEDARALLWQLNSLGVLGEEHSCRCR